MSPSGVDTARIARWVGDIAAHAEAAIMIGKLAEQAIPALCAYLARGPEVIPQPRCFAVAMLGRLPGPAVTDALRAVLHANPVRDLSPLLAESECVVKNAVVDALVGRDDPEIAADVACGIAERLRSAVVAAGSLRLGGSAAALAALLDDDALADSTAASLALLGDAAADTLIARLDAWAVAAEWSARPRITLLRAMLVLHALRAEVPLPVLDHLRHVGHPALRAAAALLQWPEAQDPARMCDLLHGAVGFDWSLGDACRAALRGRGQAARAAALAVGREAAEPDLYGNLHPLTSEAAAWLQQFIASGDTP